MSRLKTIAAAAALLGATAAQAQVVLVCQTPQFWCKISAPSTMNGASCYCNSQGGAVDGSTIVPIRHSNIAMSVTGSDGTGAAGAPAATAPSGGGAVPPPLPNQTAAVSEDPIVSDEPQAEGDFGGECFDGLGNCAGAYMDYDR